jgi:hypothetical protein
VKKANRSTPERHKKFLQTTLAKKNGQTKHSHIEGLFQVINDELLAKHDEGRKAFKKAIHRL